MTGPAQFWSYDALTYFSFSNKWGWDGFWNYSLILPVIPILKCTWAIFLWYKRKLVSHFFHSFGHNVWISGLIFLTAYLRPQTAPPLCMLFFKVFHKILPNTDPGRMLPRTSASSVYSALVRFLTHKISPDPCVVLPQKHTQHFFFSCFVQNFVTNVLEVYIMASWLLLGPSKSP